MKSFKYVSIGLLLIILVPASTTAAGFMLGEETKGVTIGKAEDVTLTIRFRLQPRLDLGDLTQSRDGSSYESESDLYLRRTRLEFEGNLVKNLKYAIHLSGDKWGKAGQTDKIGLFYAYLDYKFLDTFSLRAGKANLPYSRVSLTSSSKQLLIERPVSTEAAKKLFDDFEQPNVLAHGKFRDGIVAYYFAYADGWAEGKTLRTGNTVHKAAPLWVARVELALPGWIEEGKSDAHIGKGRHLTLGLHYAAQGSIQYQENAFEEDRELLGFDLSGHWKGVTAQFEYNQWKEDYTEPAKRSKEPEGWYLQAGYLMDGINLEPVVRYEQYDQDANATEKTEEVWTVGANWYAKGHSLKISANWGHSEFDRQASGWLAADDTKDIFQLQAQLYF
jgi:phosphate-selective porin